MTFIKLQETAVIKRYFEELRQYLKHADTCCTKQDWTDCLCAVADLPESIEKHNYEEQLRHQMNTCTCGIDELINKIEKSFE